MAILNILNTLESSTLLLQNGPFSNIKKTQNRELVNLRCVTYAQQIHLNNKCQLTQFFRPYFQKNKKNQFFRPTPDIPTQKS